MLVIAKRRGAPWQSSIACCPSSSTQRTAAVWIPQQQSQQLQPKLQNLIVEKGFACEFLACNTDEAITESKKKLMEANRLILVLDCNMTYRENEFCATLIQVTVMKPVCVIEGTENAFINLAEKWPELKDYRHVKTISSSALPDQFLSWLKNEIIFFLSVGASGDQFIEFDTIVQETLLLGYETCENKSNLMEWDAISDNMEKSSRVIAVYFRPPGKIPSHARGHLYHLAIDQCICLKKSLMCIVKAFSATDSGGEDKVFDNHRIRHFTEMIDQPSRDERLWCLKEWLWKEPKLPAVSVTFGSMGASFAWQYATGFLCFILPSLQKKIVDELIDSNAEPNCIRQQVLSDFNIGTNDPKTVCILEKFIILLKENDLDVEEHVNPYPGELFDGCRKVRSSVDATKGLELRFESPGYAKRIPAYVTELDKPVQTDNAEYTHVLVFGGFAAPTSVIHDLNDLTSEEKHQEYRVFREELQFILNHPKANDLLRKFSCLEREEVTDNVEKTACVIQLDRDKDENHWNSLIRARIREEVANQDATDRLTEIDEQGCLEEKSLLLKYSKSITDDQTDALQEKLREMKFLTQNFQMMSKTFAQVLLSCKRVLLIATLQDLEEFRRDYDLPEYSDKKHNHLLRDINSAVTYMHKREEYNLVLIVVTENRTKDIYSVLPSSLKILPEKNVVSVVNLDANNLDDIEYAFTEGATQRVKFSELIEKLGLTDPCVKVDENLPLMSMAYAMAANSCLGFLAMLVEYLQREQKPPFSLPYFYVLPASGRFPDPKGLVNAFREIGVEQGVEEFKNSEGRCYSYKVYRRDELTVAFEVPPGILNLRKQAGCGLGGVKRRDLKRNLKEYCLAKQAIIRQKNWDGYFRMAQWNDVTDLPSDGWKHPTKEYAESLWQQLTKEVTRRQVSMTSLSSQSSQSNS